jgi:hypothetical protein
VRSTYQSLRESLERERLSREAQQSERVEFNVIDPPAAGFEPIAPNRPQLLAIVLFAGLGGGGGLAFLLSQLRPVFYTPDTLREATGLPVLGAVSLGNKGFHRMRRRLAVFAYGTAGMALLTVFVGLVFIEWMGPGVRGLVGGLA